MWSRNENHENKWPKYIHTWTNHLQFLAASWGQQPSSWWGPAGEEKQKNQCPCLTRRSNTETNSPVWVLLPGKRLEPSSMSPWDWWGHRPGCTSSCPERPVWGNVDSCNLSSFPSINVTAGLNFIFVCNISSYSQICGSKAVLTWRRSVQTLFRTTLVFWGLLGSWMRAEVQVKLVAAASCGRKCKLSSFPSYIEVQEIEGHCIYWLCRVVTSTTDTFEDSNSKVSKITDRQAWLQICYFRYFCVILCSMIK